MACIQSTAHTYYDCTVPRIQPKYMLSISNLHHWTSVFRFKILWSLYPSLSTIYLSFIFLNPRTQRSLCIPASELPCEAKCRWPEALHKFTLLTFPALSSAALQRALGAAWSGNFAATVGMPPHFSLWGCVGLERSIDKGKGPGALPKIWKNWVHGKCSGFIRISATSEMQITRATREKVEGSFSPQQPQGSLVVGPARSKPCFTRSRFLQPVFRIGPRVSEPGTVDFGPFQRCEPNNLGGSPPISDEPGDGKFLGWDTKLMILLGFNG